MKKKDKYTKLFFLVIVILSSFFACQNKDTEKQVLEEGQDVVIKSSQANPTTYLEPILPLPEVSTAPKKTELGRVLFHDKRLSKDNSVSCATCHNLKTGGTDLLPKSVGVEEREGTHNSPTIYNSIFSFAYFWDGRAQTLEEQMDGPLQNSVEMSTSWDNVIEKFNKDKEFVKEYNDVYKGAITEENLKNALATFEKSLVTPSRFDDYLYGDKEAISKEELKGYKLFKKYGCTNCHQGVNVGGNMFQKLGVLTNYFENKEGGINEVDYGRFLVTKDSADMFVFKVPSLRNVAITKPYFHDGSIKSLEEAVKTMGNYQLGKTISDEDVSLIISFLKSLTGKGLEQK